MTKYAKKNTNTTTTKVSKDFVYNMVTDRIIAQLEKGVVPWHRPWTLTADSFGYAWNFVSKKPYRGINPFILSHPGEPYITWKQCKALNHKVVNPGNYEIVVFWKQWDTGKVKTDADGNVILNEKTGKPEHIIVPVLRYYKVYWIGDTDIEYKPSAISFTKNQSHDLAEKVIQNYLSQENHPHFTARKQNEAYYRPSTDSVFVPCLEQYDKVEEYYSTAFHELTHSTGHVSRLNRLKNDSFGDKEYSKEELVAELGAATLVNLCGLETESSFNNSASYIAGWLKALKNDKKFVVFAGSQAQKAVEWITDGMDFISAEEEDGEEETTEEVVSSPVVQEVKPETVSVNVFQLNKVFSKEYAFMPYDFVSSKTNIRSAMYDKVYSCTFPKETTLDDMYRIFNIEHPADYKTRSLSVSDVLQVNDKFYYVDSIGYAELTDFFEELETVEKHNNTNTDKAFHSLLKYAKKCKSRPTLTKLQCDDNYSYLTDSFIAVRTKDDVYGIEKAENPVKMNKLYDGVINNATIHDFLPELETLKTAMTAGRKQKKEVLFMDTHNNTYAVKYLIEAVTYTGTNEYRFSSNIQPTFISGNGLDYVICPIRQYEDNSLRPGFNFIDRK